MAVVLEDHDVHRGGESVGRIGGDQVDFAASERGVEQPEIHRHRISGDAVAVSLKQTVETVGALLELVADAHPPGLRGGSLARAFSDSRRARFRRERSSRTCC